MTGSERMLTNRPLRMMACGLLGALAVLAGSGCTPPATPPSANIPLNTTDFTNDGASYVGSGACAPCHSGIALSEQIHGHNHILNQVFGVAPGYPPEATRAGVPNPPPGFDWGGVSYVIGGYLRKANFLDSQGFLLTDGTAKTTTQWDLAFPPTQTAAHWDSFLPGQTTPLPYNFDCFRCHTTAPSATGSMVGLPGIQGTWLQANVKCEACHGPGSKHIVAPPRDIYVNPGADFCGQCHTRQSGVILASGGFILNEQQYPELQASPHTGFQCVACHDPHTSPNYQLQSALVNDCQNCHAGQTMALHAGKTYKQGDYTEVVTCHSCHMPFATRSATSVVSGAGRVGDVRTHIFRLSTEPVDYTAMFTADGSQVAVGPDGQAAITLDFVCLRCHNGAGNVFTLDLPTAASIATGIHQAQ